MKLADYLDGMRGANTAEELETAIQADFKHGFRGRTWTQICKVRIAAGERIVAAHPHAFYVPRFGEQRRLTLCGETYKVGRGQNAAGVRYAWHDAGQWAMSLLIHHGLSKRAASRLWDSDWRQYPHRALKTAAAALAGEIPDPQLNVLIERKLYGHEEPIRYTVAQNEADKSDRRASRPCQCGGTLFDWGAGHSDGFDYVSWYCNSCPRNFTEYMTPAALQALRQGARLQAHSHN